ncbi:hypothetical protein GUITHDRAFT_101818 [Guillardia theta CCMP2712]|uniref:Uncharacterized protein n=1 Tax=Guillardia theta (strain CCMP2712) TaxID=905079 RepID=L1JWA7_GUITC|nr:hypothetical protein GUITHDRAFT_101818 [Guillardia theta CCMP2712]EKX52657.1 hypothetical protein GUITHDRAFT_101818 [Guillardia theta CCMP2712]|eukprot:XP_005839637.1 hypothetical protein GUITHDRAFT_101818 [Guillardia theta CCMP2712]
MWVRNPCRQVYEDVDVPLKHRARDADCFFNQLSPSARLSQGHLIRGEERLAVLWDGYEPSKDPSSSELGRVYFAIRSVSAGSGLVGSLLFPFMRPMQDRFFASQLDSMQTSVSEKP